MGSNRIVLFYFFFTLNKKSDKLYLGGFVVSSINDKIREYIDINEYVPGISINRKFVFYKNE